MGKNQLSHTYYSQNLFLLLALEDKTQVSTETKSQWNHSLLHKSWQYYYPLYISFTSYSSTYYK